MDAEWDDNKRLSNIEKHGVDFVRAASIFEEWFLDQPQVKRDSGEERFAAIGKTGDLILYVVYTWRENRRRIISARQAGRDEREEYNQSLPKGPSQNEGSD